MGLRCLTSHENCEVGGRDGLIGWKKHCRNRTLTFAMGDENLRSSTFTMDDDNLRGFRRRWAGQP